MRPLRTLLSVAATTALALAVMAGPAGAMTPNAPYTYYATIDCGAGPVEVGSWDDIWAPLVDLESGKKYKPVAWHVSVGELVIDEVKKRERKHAVECTYSDGVAAGTVTVKRA
ncbi:MAG TPA: hypothetical protein VFO81_03565 [Gaiellaceae bacterium]|nr:hypothetical protein [Gaiellaceae bacterium]